MGILAPRLPEARVLDLFAGTGAVGLAAYSKGAAEVTFVEADRRVAGALRRNLPDNCRLLIGKLPAALAKLEGPYDLILADPPYNTDFGLRCLDQIARLLEPQGLFVVEHHHKEPYPDTAPGLLLERRKRYGETALSFYAKVPCSGEPDHL